MSPRGRVPRGLASRTTGSAPALVYTQSRSHRLFAPPAFPRRARETTTARTKRRINELNEGEPLSPAVTTTVELIHRIRGGEPAASERLATRFVDALCRWASGRLPARARRMVDTEDLVQDALMRTMARLDGIRLEHPGALQSYLRQAVMNRIRDEVRRANARPLDDRSFPDMPSRDPSPLESAIGEELLQNYEAALERLKPVEKDAVLARIELGLSYEEIAAALGKPSTDAARMTVRRAVLQLAEVLGHRG